MRQKRRRIQEKAQGKSESESAEPDPAKVALIDRIAELRTIRTARADHLKHVLDSFESKGGDPADTQEIRAYIAAVGGVRVDTQNVQTTLLTLAGVGPCG